MGLACECHPTPRGQARHLLLEEDGNAGLGATGWPGSDRLFALHLPRGEGPDRSHFKPPKVPGRLK